MSLLKFSIDLTQHIHYYERRMGPRTERTRGHPSAKECQGERGNQGSPTLERRPAEPTEEKQSPKYWLNSRKISRPQSLMIRTGVLLVGLGPSLVGLGTSLVELGLSILDLGPLGSTVSPHQINVCYKVKLLMVSMVRKQSISQA